MHPIRFNINRVIPFLQEDNIGHNIGSRIGFKCVVRKSDHTKKFSSLSKIFSNIWALLIHRISACNKSNDTARSYLIQSLSEEIVVNWKAKLVVWFITDFIISERHIADRYIVEIPSVSFFKSADFNISIRVKFLSNSTGDRIKLNSIKIASSHRFRKKSKEVTNAHRWFQDISRLKSHLGQRFIHCLDDYRTCIVGIQCRSSCHLIFLFRQQILQLLIFAWPVRFIAVKCVRKTAPADIVRQNLLFFKSRITVIFFQVIKQLYRFNISCKLLFRTTFT